jgi:hypothetical protein
MSVKNMNQETIDEKDVSQEEKDDALAKVEEREVPVAIEVKNLVVSPLPRLQMALGDAQSFIEVVNDTSGVKAIVWSEEAISLVLDDRNSEIMFRPEIHPTSAMFFQREEKHRYDPNKDELVRTWDGDFAPVRFLKTKLLQFLKKYAEQIPEEVAKSIKNLRVTEKRVYAEDTIELGTRKIDEETEATNLPRKFSVNLPISENFVGELHFEAQLVKKKDRYGDAKPGKQIELRCINSREVLRDMMTQILAEMPEDIPKYYGKMRMHDG